MRVVSLLPSATEIVCALDAQDLLVGRSHECDWPTSLARLPVLTAARTTFESSAQVDAAVRSALAGASANASLYTLDADRLAALAPDLIITQDLCHVCSIDLSTVRAVAAELKRRTGREPRVISLNPQTLEGVFDDILGVGDALDLPRRADALVASLRQRMYAAGDHVNPYADGPGVAFIEWLDPIFVGGHWTPQLIERAGGRHPLNPTRVVQQAGAAAGPIGSTQREAGPSVNVTSAALLASRPERVIVCPCGLSLATTRDELARFAASPAGEWWRELISRPGVQVALVDGNHLFSRPGPRLVDAFEWLVGWLNGRPDLTPEGMQEMVEVL
jgi:ABC-type Fe3+-hydroxamate transport system substrate-binding protein